MDDHRRAAHLSPDWDYAERQVRAWSADVGLTTNADGEHALARMGRGGMAGWLASDADRFEPALLSRRSVFIAVVDDGFDHERAEPERVRVLLEQLIGVLEGVDIPRGYPAVAALADLWPRRLAGAASGWAVRFVEVYRRHADATYTAVELCARGGKQGLADHPALRRHTITALPT
ncbi:terpene synthase family protein [Actinosynnema sp. CS-041913]|uniref:terpene synthase family protein n=1 Tax=Actinosynnema sp. CS-041913 TaxID=3239917 RepID=UPI003D8DDB30